MDIFQTKIFRPHISDGNICEDNVLDYDILTKHVTPKIFDKIFQITVFYKICKMKICRQNIYDYKYFNKLLTKDIV